MGKILVTGAAGFIGSHIVDRLLSEGHSVIGYDNFSTGQREFLAEAAKNPKFELVEGDVLDPQTLKKAAQGCEAIFHLAANADVRFGLNHPNKDLEQNTFATFQVLEAMRANGIKRIVFSSTGSVYGEAEVIPTPENAPFPVQTSLYGASKVAGESLISAYCKGYGFSGLIFRFVSFLGERYTHGHVFDFYKKLSHNPERLEILGDGRGRKSYVYIQDGIDAIVGLYKNPQYAKPGCEIFNLGTEEECDVLDSARWISEELKLRPEIIPLGKPGENGWIGDNRRIFLDTKKIQSTGWKPKKTIEESVKLTLRWIQQNKWILEKR